MQAWSFPTDWPLSPGVTRLIWVRLSLRLAPSPRRPGLHFTGASRIGSLRRRARPATWLTGHSKVNSFQFTRQKTGFTDAPEARRHGGALEIPSDSAKGSSMLIHS